MYLTYEEYQDYGGTLVSPELFDGLQLRAKVAMDNYTLKPSLTVKLLDTFTKTNIKLAMVELVDNLHLQAQATLEAQESDRVYYAGIGSESVKDHTVSFKLDGSGQSKVLSDFQSQRQAIMQEHLLVTGLLSRGL